MPQPPSPSELQHQMQAAYADRVSERADKRWPAWKQAETERFLQYLQAEKRTTLLEIGAGTGQASHIFAEAGLRVITTDLSWPMLAFCRQNGLTTCQASFFDLPFSTRSIGAVWGMNCLLHIPKRNLPAVLQEIRRVLVVGGLFYWGMYGGRAFEGIFEDDHYRPQRFFSFFPDAEVQAVAQEYFTLLDFRTLDVSEGDLHFQALTLQSGAR